MRHTHYSRVNTQTGAVEQLPFSDVDGRTFGEPILDTGYSTRTALLIVNRWNYINTLQPNPHAQYFYYVHSVDGAA
jgi:hypothetical protein